MRFGVRLPRTGRPHTPEDRLPTTLPAPGAPVLAPPPPKSAEKGVGARWSRRPRGDERPRNRTPTPRVARAGACSEALGAPEASKTRGPASVSEVLAKKVEAAGTRRSRRFCSTAARRLSIRGFILSSTPPPRPPVPRAKRTRPQRQPQSTPTKDASASPTSIPRPINMGRTCWALTL